MTEEEQVNHPPHYGGGDNPFEVIKIIEHFGLNFALGSAVKYILRAGKKQRESDIIDLRKAAWYCNREAERLEALQDGPHHSR
jgi:hypothetical protein